MARTDRLLKRLKASRLDGTYEAEMRRLITVDVLVLDDFAIHPLDTIETSDIYDYAESGIMPSRPTTVGV
jgi:DNA replication protein DnaC